MRERVIQVVTGGLTLVSFALAVMGFLYTDRYAESASLIISGVVFGTTFRETL